MKKTEFFFSYIGSVVVEHIENATDEEKEQMVIEAAKKKYESRKDMSFEIWEENEVEK